MKRSTLRLFNLTLVSAVLVSATFADVVPSSLFQDHMVLQRDMPVPVWGKADPGEAIRVEFGEQIKQTTADVAGKWTVRLDPIKEATLGREMRLVGANTVVLKDVVVGEVWICSGQSNMAMGTGGVPEVKALSATANNIRCFEVANTVAFEEQETVRGKWSEGPPSSAVAFAFAYFLEEKAEVPVGIILTSWGSLLHRRLDATGYDGQATSLQDDHGESSTLTKKSIKNSMRSWQRAMPGLPLKISACERNPTSSSTR